MVRGGKVKESYRAADGDIARGSEDYYNESIEEAYIDYNEVEFGLAKIDLLKVNATEEEMNQDIEDIDYSEAEALTTYGIIGIKVWIYKGEVFAREFSQETNKVTQKEVKE